MHVQATCSVNQNFVSSLFLQVLAESELMRKETDDIGPHSSKCTVPIHKHFAFILFLQVLAESEQMRKEADDIGPRAELEHWKKRMSKFNYLVDQIKSPPVKAVLGCLQAAKSKSLKVNR